MATYCAFLTMVVIILSVTLVAHILDHIHAERALREQLESMRNVIFLDDRRVNVR